ILCCAALGSRAYAASGFVSVPLEAGTNGAYTCSLTNNDAQHAALVTFLFFDEHCLLISSAIKIPPTQHRTATLQAGVLSAPVRCNIVLEPSNQADRGELLPVFAVTSGGQTTATVGLAYRKAVPGCIP